MVEQPVIAVGSGMVKLVNDDDIEPLGLNLSDPALEGLDHREDMAARRGPPAREKLTEIASPQHSPVGRERLSQDLLAMGDEQQRQSALVAVEELAIVERSDDGLARARCRHHQIAMAIVPLPLDHQRIEHPLLMRIRPHVEAGKRDRR